MGISKVTVAMLSNALNKCCADDALQKRSRKMAESLQAEDGLANAVSIIDRFLVEEVATGEWAVWHEARRARNCANGVAANKRCFFCCSRRAKRTSPVHTQAQ